MIDSGDDMTIRGLRHVVIPSRWVYCWEQLVYIQLSMMPTVNISLLQTFSLVANLLQVALAKKEMLQQSDE
jgi:hypothetical protein